VLHADGGGVMADMVMAREMSSWSANVNMYARKRYHQERTIRGFLILNHIDKIL